MQVDDDLDIVKCQSCLQFQHTFQMQQDVFSLLFQLLDLLHPVRLPHSQTAEYSCQVSPEMKRIAANYIRVDRLSTFDFNDEQKAYDKVPSKDSCFLAVP